MALLEVLTAVAVTLVIKTVISIAEYLYNLIKNGYAIKGDFGIITLTDLSGDNIECRLSYHTVDGKM